MSVRRTATPRQQRRVVRGATVTLRAVIPGSAAAEGEEGVTIREVAREVARVVLASLRGRSELAASMAEGEARASTTLAVPPQVELAAMGGTATPSLPTIQPFPQSWA